MARDDYYASLGLQRGATPAEIKHAYRQLALESHPDRFPGDVGAEARFRAISEAYAVLSDPQERARYDAEITFAGALELTRAPTLQSARDIFNGLFGDVLGQQRRARRRGRDLRYTLTVDLAAAVLGSTHDIAFECSGPCSQCSGKGTKQGGRGPKPCPACEGRGNLRAAGLLPRRAVCGRCEGLGMLQTDPCAECRGRGARTETRSFSVRLPPGSSGGDERVLIGQGEPGRFGGDAGDLRVTVSVRPHPYLQREGRDLLCDVPVSVTELALGGPIRVATLDGEATVEVPAGVSSGARLRLKGRGVPDVDGARGDQIVTVVIELPILTPAVRDSLKALQRECETQNALPRRRALHDALDRKGRAE